MESYRLAELKYAFFRRTERKTKKLPRSKLFLWTVLKHGLLEGSTILLQYSAITLTPLGSSRLGELEYAILPGYDVRPKNKSVRKCKKWHCAMSVHGHCIADWFRQVRTSLYKSEQVWTVVDRCEQVWKVLTRFGQVRTGVNRYFSSTVSCTASKFGPPPNLCAVF